MRNSAASDVDYFLKAFQGQQFGTALTS